MKAYGLENVPPGAVGDPGRLGARHGEHEDRRPGHGPQPDHRLRRLDAGHERQGRRRRGHHQGPHQGRPGEVQGQAEGRRRSCTARRQRRPGHRPALPRRPAGQEGRAKKDASPEKEESKSPTKRSTKPSNRPRQTPRKTISRRRTAAQEGRSTAAWRRLRRRFRHRHGVPQGRGRGLHRQRLRQAARPAGHDRRLAGRPRRRRGPAAARVHGPRALRPALPPRQPRRSEARKVEIEITNKFIPGPITVYNTVGEVRGSEKPDEFVVVGAHLDSWDLAQGTTDNGTGSCIVLETARAVAALAKAG